MFDNTTCPIPSPNDGALTIARFPFSVLKFTMHCGNDPIRMLFDYLVVGQIIPLNPAASVRGPKHIVTKGKTPVLTAEETRHLLDSIDCTKIIGLRDRALIGVMVYSFARVSAAIGMNVEDYYPQGR